MKTLRNLMIGLIFFYAVMTAFYTVWTAVIDNDPEWVAIVAFILMTLFAAFIAWYMSIEHKPFKTKVLPEDREDAEIHEADPELGVFSPYSIWPVVAAGGAALVFASIAFGWWPAFFLAPIGLVGLLGWMFEMYRGKFGH